jgi:hypothetical protein
MPSLDTQYTQYGLDTSDGPPCASTSESLPCARVLLASGDITRAHKHQLERLTDRLTKRFRAVIRGRVDPSQRCPRIPAPCSLSAAASWRLPTIGVADPAACFWWPRARDCCGPGAIVSWIGSSVIGLGVS